MKTKKSFRLIRIVAVLFALPALVGCVGYQLGSMLPPDIETVCVPTFVNETPEPQIEMEATQAAIAQLQEDGSLRVVDRRNADAILEVVLEDYELTPVSFERHRETRANEYRITLTAAFILTRRETGEVIAQNPRIKGKADFVFSGDLSSAKRRAFPEAAEDLAHHLVECVVEAW